MHMVLGGGSQQWGCGATGGGYCARRAPDAHTAYCIPASTIDKRRPLRRKQELRNHRNAARRAVAVQWR
jgi:hypothetical protein